MGRSFSWDVLNLVNYLEVARNISMYYLGIIYIYY